MFYSQTVSTTLAGYGNTFKRKAVNRPLEDPRSLLKVID
jgi:hypothetical protein